MPARWCEGSTSRFDSDPHSVCPVWCTTARRTVTVYYRVLISEWQRGWVWGRVLGFFPKSMPRLVRRGIYADHSYLNVMWVSRRGGAV